MRLNFKCGGGMSFAEILFLHSLRDKTVEVARPVFGRAFQGQAGNNSITA